MMSFCDVFLVSGVSLNSFTTSLTRKTFFSLSWQFGIFHKLHLVPFLLLSNSVFLFCARANKERICHRNFTERCDNFNEKAISAVDNNFAIFQTICFFFLHKFFNDPCNGHWTIHKKTEKIFTSCAGVFVCCVTKIVAKNEKTSVPKKTLRNLFTNLQS